ncbi:MAG: hypothetical protein Q8P59_05480, partial [Dehalococcoidia bacterium]|nr:hypothetical protein [Dehalococcoidia bacterium]
MSARRTIQRDKSWAPVTFGLISPAGQPAARVQQWPHPIQGRGIGDLLYRIARKSRIAILRARVLAQRGLGKASQALGGSSGIRFGSNNLEDFETVPTSFPGLQEMLDGHGVPYLTLPQSYLARLAPLLDPSRLRAIFCPSLWRMTIQERDVLTNYVE